jgi:hypothetical protein
MSRSTGKKAVRYHGQGLRGRRPTNPNRPRLVFDSTWGELAQIRATRRTGHALSPLPEKGAADATRCHCAAMRPCVNGR